MVRRKWTHDESARVSGLQLTPRERAVLRRLAHGDSNVEIAERLNIREQTVKNHVSVLLQKLHVRNRVQLAVLAVCEWPELARTLKDP
jgi:DNA-binding NarL/FixJ family response regulator